jgi:hypothetical protein
MATRRTALIVWSVFVGGPLVLTVVGTAVGPRIWSRVSDAGNLVAWVVFVMALACVLASRIVPSGIKPVAGATPDNVAVARSVVASALNGSIALYAAFAGMISGRVIALVALAISVIGLLLDMPTDRRWQELRRGSVVTMGHERVALGAPWTRSPRKVHLFFALLCVGGMTALALLGHIFWTEEVLRQPSSPSAWALLSLVLASMMTMLAVGHFMVAAASRRPWWQRARGLLLFLFAGYLLVQAIRMM